MIRNYFDVIYMRMDQTGFIIVAGNLVITSISILPMALFLIIVNTSYVPSSIYPYSFYIRTPASALLLSWLNRLFTGISFILLKRILRWFNLFDTMNSFYSYLFYIPTLAWLLFDSSFERSSILIIIFFTLALLWLLAQQYRFEYRSLKELYKYACAHSVCFACP